MRAGRGAPWEVRSVLPGKSTATGACVPEIGEIALGGQVQAGSGQSYPFSGGIPYIVKVGSKGDFSPPAQEAFAKYEKELESPTVCYAEIDPSGSILVLDPDTDSADEATMWKTEGWLLDKSGIAGSPHITATVPSGTDRDLCLFVGATASDSWFRTAAMEGTLVASQLRSQFSPTVRFASDNRGNLHVFGAGAITAVREGHGDGTALREDGWGHAFRLGGGHGDAIRTGTGRGMAFRDDEGDGSALKSGRGSGDAVRDGSGSGDAYNSCSGTGNARRGDSGNGNASRAGDGRGSASRNGDGDGNAFRSGKGDGNAVKYGSGDGFAERRGSGDGNALAERVMARRTGEGKGLSKVTCEPSSEDTQHQHADRVVMVSVLDPATNEYRLVARYDGREPTTAELEQHAEDHYPDMLAKSHLDVVRTEKGGPAAWTLRT